MIAAKDIVVGERFRVVNDGRTKRSFAFLLNGHLGNPDKITALKAGTELEVVGNKQQIQNSKLFSIKVKVVGKEEESEVLFDEFRSRCEKIYITVKKPTMSYTISEIAHRIYYVQFQNSFELAMTFLRYQECYESSSPEFRNKSFNLIDYQRWYASTIGKGEFTYTKDRSIFSIPSKIIDMNMEQGFIKDWNSFDSEMKLINKTIKAIPDNQSYYLIGSCNSDHDALRHEVARGLFFTSSGYRICVNDLINSTPLEVQTAMFDILKKMGHDESVLRDEFQAYMSTGLTSEMQEVEVIAKFNREKTFVRTFDEFTREVLF
jgi:hypothetical protein